MKFTRSSSGFSETDAITSFFTVVVALNKLMQLARQKMHARPNLGEPRRARSSGDIAVVWLPVREPGCSRSASYWRRKHSVITVPPAERVSCLESPENLKRRKLRLDLAQL